MAIAELKSEAPVAEAKAAHLAAVDVHRTFRNGSLETKVLHGVDLEIHRGEFVAIVGQSGSGKSTLLHLLGTLDQPDAGEIRFQGDRIDNIDAAGRDILRNRYFGMIFQFYHLLPELSTLENVLMPHLIQEGIFRWFARRGGHVQRAKDLLAAVGLSHRMKHKPKQLSGGEMQRAAIARALIAEPEILLADEPTGNLDQSTGREILDILNRLNEKHGLTILMVTHDESIAHEADRCVRLCEGRIDDREPQQQELAWGLTPG